MHDELCNLFLRLKSGQVCYLHSLVFKTGYYFIYLFRVYKRFIALYINHHIPIRFTLFFQVLPRNARSHFYDGRQSLQLCLQSFPLP